ncbi:MAG TPA: peptidylprolyl isomerase [Smithellaceae bacterium]|nr:peptidylprolyl isomerase [Syntrophaceae bacterium]HOE23207.1 peptidylprolyl isomerase [Smithellaceae bacterium]HOU56223.1 peptidylprolyl isomerase [Smithellaceae bacterium]HPL32002.1 peptidylprolyl isomerase [Smithellaceae bacterium]HPV71741.1 peptidylprolyl isomerase [Smithellaceae bacterium]
MKAYKTGFAVILAVLLISAPAAAGVADRIVAVVNGEVITLSELHRAFAPYAAHIEANYKGPDKEAFLKQGEAAFLQRMIDQILIEQEAKKPGVGIAAVKDEEVMGMVKDMLAKNRLTMQDYLKKLAEEGKTLESAKQEIRGQMLRMRLLRREVQSRILVTDEEIGEYYDKHREDYEGREAVHIRQIFLPVPEGADSGARDRVRAEANQLRERILKGERFEVMAARYSRGPAASEGGDIGFVERGVMMPEVEKAAFSLPVGEVSEVLETEAGFLLLVVVDKKGAGLKPLPVVRDEIKAKIEDEKVNKKYDEWMAELRKKSFIDIRL